MNTPCPHDITLRPIAPEDQTFLFQVYASTREEERGMVGWSEQVWGDFVRQQFEFQHAQYQRGYANPTFDLVLVGGTPAGRLYVDRQESEIRVIDIALLPEYRRQGIGRQLLAHLVGESEANGCPLGLHVERNNPILDFYRRLGFGVAADRGVYFYMTRCPSTEAAYAAVA